MTRRTAFAVALTALLALVAGCAATDQQGGAGSSAYTSHAEPAARIGLPPAYRVFYDELQDEGDWTLVEPYGWVFRPRVNFVAWRPYQDGWWEPSDYYGWIWNTYEPFGWITYHYGTWFYDEYQGWVWAPGPVWGPAWVAWVESNDYIGWAPLPPATYDRFDTVPDGVFTYAPVSQFTARNVAQQATFAAHLPSGGSRFHAIVNVGRVNNVVFNKGPDLVELQRRAGALGERADETAIPRVRLGAGAPAITESDLQSRTARMVDEGERELRLYRDQGVMPPVMHEPAPPMPSPPAEPAGPPPPHYKPSAPAAPADTLHKRRAPTPRPARPPHGAPRDSTARADSTAHGHGKKAPGHRPPSVPDAEPDSTRKH